MISVVIPIYNEELLIDELVSRTIAALEKIEVYFEIIIIDDGSTDKSLQKLIKINKSDKRIKVIQLSKNYGHQSAFTAGLTISAGEYIVMMDGDLQDPPELIEEMYRKLTGNKDLDIVYAKRRSKQENTYRKLLMSFFHKLFHRISSLEHANDAGNFSIFTKEVKEAIMLYTEKIRYIPGLRLHVGFAQDYIMFDRDTRFAGKSKMNLSKLFSLALDAIFSFSYLPIRFMLILGVIGVLTSLLGFVYVFASKFLGIAPYGWSSNLFFMFFFNSLQITFIGIIGEYIYRIYKEVQNRPLFIIKRKIE